MSIFPAPEFIQSDDVRVAYYEFGAEHKGKSPTVVFCHGFPELAFSWRHQLRALAAAGFHAIALDQRGYGASDCPPEISDYTMGHLTADVAALLDAKGLDKAIFCGHDWGSLVIWSMPFYFPARVQALISLNVPFKPRAPIDNVTAMNKMFGEDNYINFFQTPGDAEALFDPDPEKAFRFFMRRPDAARLAAKTDHTGPDAETPDTQFTIGLAFQKLFIRPESEWPGNVFLTDEELAYFTKAFQRTGFRGGLNWYRNFRANWEYADRFQPAGAPPPQLDMPVLMIMAALDVVLPPKISEDMPDYCSDLETHLVRTSGHWTQQEEPGEVNGVILEWLKRRFGN